MNKAKGFSAVAAIGLIGCLPIPLASAESPVVPRPNASCSRLLNEVRTWNFSEEPAAEYTNLMCARAQGQQYRWSVVPVAYPTRKWLSLGYGRDGEVKSTLFSGSPTTDGKYMIDYPSTWLGMPQTDDTECIAEQTPQIGPGAIGRPSSLAAGTGQPLVFEVIPNLFDLRLSGYCMWTEFGSG